MDAVTAEQTCVSSKFRSLFRFSGRMNRAQYWGWTFALMGISFVSTFVLTFLLGILGAVSMFFVGFFTVLIIVVQIALIWISLAMCSKRLHDFDFSFWWSLFPLIFLFVMFKGGTKGPNRFGDVP